MLNSQIRSLRFLLSKYKNENKIQSPTYTAHSNLHQCVKHPFWSIEISRDEGAVDAISKPIQIR